MPHPPRRARGVHSAPRRRAPRRELRPLALVAFLSVAGLVSAPALAGPLPESNLTVQDGALQAPAQQLRTASDVALPVPSRDEVGASTPTQALTNGGTNYDWAKLVLTYAGWPVTDSNVTVFTRWMRQENGPDDWWNRNNPLNNGWGSGGGGGLGSYDSLVTAAENAADALTTHNGYAGIAAGFAASTPAAQIEQAIWASPWASSHYANGSHWSHRPVPVVTAPPGAWE